MEATSTPPLLDNRRRLYFARRAKGLQAGVSLLLLAAYYWRHHIVYQAELGQYAAPETASLSDRLVQLGVGLQLALLIPALVALIQWQLRAYQNVHRLPGAKPRYGVNMAGWAWFIPIASFWMPYQVMADIGRYIGGFDAGSHDAVRTRWDVLLPIWWGLHIGELVMARVIWNSPDGGSLPELLTATRLQLGAQALGLLADLALLWLLSQLAPAERNLPQATGNTPPPADAAAADENPVVPALG